MERVPRSGTGASPVVRAPGWADERNALLRPIVDGGGSIPFDGSLVGQWDHAPHHRADPRRLVNEMRLTNLVTFPSKTNRSGAGTFSV